MDSITLSIKKDSVNKSRATLLDIFVVISVLLSFFLHQYTSIIPGITLGEFFLMLSSLIVLFSKKIIIRSNNCLLIFAFYLIGLFFTFISIFLEKNSFALESFAEIGSRWVRYFAYTVFFIVFIDFFNSNKSTKKIYLFFCFLISLYAIIQFLFFYSFSIVLPSRILPISSNAFFGNDVIGDFSNGYFRVCSIFSEPAYMCKFLAPGLIISLKDFLDKKSNPIVSIIILASILLSASLQGIIISLVSVAIVVLFSHNTKAKILLAFISIVLVILLLVFYSRGLFNGIVDRIENISEGNADYSTKIRLFRGFFYWNELPLFNKLFGVGFGNSANFAYSNNIYTIYDYYIRDASSLGYMNGISLILVENGLLLFVLFCVFIIKSFNKVNLLGKTLIIQWILFLFAGSAFLSVISVFYCFLIYLFRRQNGV